MTRLVVYTGIFGRRDELRDYSRPSQARGICRALDWTEGPGDAYATVDYVRDMRTLVGCDVRVITIICESFNAYDVEVVPAWLAKFQRRYFDLSPAYDSVSALTLLQNGTCRPYKRRKITRPIFGADQDLVALRHKTRIFSSMWPRYCNADLLDPSANYDDANRRWKMCDSTALDSTTEFLRGGHDFEHLIVWGSTGHVGQRVGTENSGIPRSLTQTWALWVTEMYDHVIKYTDLESTAVLVHPDHGSARQGIDVDDAMRAGFLFAHLPNETRRLAKRLDWPRVRELVLTKLQEK